MCGHFEGAVPSRIRAGDLHRGGPPQLCRVGERVLRGPPRPRGVIVYSQARSSLLRARCCSSREVLSRRQRRHRSTRISATLRISFPFRSGNPTPFRFAGAASRRQLQLGALTASRVRGMAPWKRCEKWCLPPEIIRHGGTDREAHLITGSSRHVHQCRREHEWNVRHGRHRHAYV